MALVRSVRSTFSPEIGIDLGTANTVIYERGSGVLLCEPSVVAYDGDDSVIAVGRAAKEMDGRAPGRIRVVHPLRGGTISDFRAAHVLIRTLVDRALTSRPRLIPRIVACVPGCATDIECKAVEESARAAGVRATTFLPQAVAAAVGAGLDIMTTQGRMVVDVGGGTTDVAVMALGGVVTEASLPLGGGDLDRVIRAMCLRSFDLVVSPAVAEQLKVGIGAAWPRAEAKMEVSGRDASNGMVRAVVVSSSDVTTAMSDVVRAMVGAAVGCIVEAPPDLANDLLARGLHLAGEAGHLDGFPRRLATAAGIPVHISEDPGRAAVVGAAQCLREVIGTKQRKQAAASRPKHARS
jgi:rod shape-determining protein MreB